jgi:predicted alpha/beta-hydrolase family hydrolase
VTRRRVVIGVSLVLIAAAAITWALFFALEADPEAASVAASVGTDCPDPCAFAFGSDAAPAGLVLYPGAGVEPAAYAPLAAEIADAGFFVTIQQAPLGLAILDSDMAQASIDAFPGIDTWAVGGHSLGGAMAARFASESDQVDGLVLLAAYPEGGLDLRDSGLEVISIYGDGDLLATPDDVLGSRPQLPADTEFVLIEGGNHAQFGAYGRQPRDGEASIPASEQRDTIARSVVTFLTGLGSSPGDG